MKNLIILTLLTIVFVAINANGNEMKKIEFIKEYTATLADITDLKAITGKDLPSWYIDHYMYLAGLKRGELRDADKDDDWHVDFTARFESGGSDSDHITDFLTAEQIKQQWPYIDYLEEDIEHFEISSDFVQWEHLFPLAGSGDGTIYVAIGGVHDRAVYEADNGDYGIGLVASDIDDFVASLGITVKPK